MKKHKQSQDVTASRHAAPVGSPMQVAIKHLLRRKLAMFSFLLVTTYFLIALLTYVRIPDTQTTRTDDEGNQITETVRRTFIGEKLEELASRRLVDQAGEPFDYSPPSLTGGIHHSASASEPEESYWDTYHDEERTPALGFHFIFGTDIQGRSVFWRTLYGARMSLSIALGASILSILIGTSLGALAGYFGGRIDGVITWLFTTVASIPRILLIMALAYALRDARFSLFGLLDEPFQLTGIPMLILAMGLTTWVSLCRLIRGEIMKLKNMDYESAARSIGLGRMRILVRHLLPNAMYLVIIQFSLIFPLFIHLEVILSYLGLGATDGISWGQMINASLTELMRSPVVWWQLPAATAAVFGISLSLNLFGDALRDALDPKLQGTS